MKIALLVIGDEMLAGRTIDANTSYFGQALTGQGLLLDHVRVIKDTHQDIEKNCRDLLDEYSVVVTCGGLGPTEDDKTKAVLAKLTNSEIIESETTAKLIAEQYARIGKTWTKDWNDYHKIPAAVDSVINHNGLAPGFFWEKDKSSWIMMAPGVPREFQSMVKETFIPKLKDHPHYKKQNLNKIFIRTHGVPEESIFKVLCPDLWKDWKEFGELGSYPQTKALGVDIVINLNETHQQLQIEELLKRPSVKELLPFIWSTDDLSIEETIIKEASSKKITLGSAESCTGGLIAHKLTSISGSSEVFNGTVVSYSNDVKKELLNVSESDLNFHGAVSEVVSKQMAIHARKVLNVDISISTSGIAGPGGGSPEKPVGTLSLGWSSDKETNGNLKQYFGNRTILKERFAYAGLFKMLSLIRSS